MKERNLIILCVIFAVLVGLVFVKKGMKPQVPTTEEAADIIASPVSADDITEVIVRLGDGGGGDEDNPRRVHLLKEDGQWAVKTRYGVHANDKAITPVLDQLDQLKGELRSKKEGLFSDYGIEDEQAVHVELRRGDAEAAHVVIGTKKAGYRNNFVRLAGTSAVYLVNENLLGAFGVRGEGEDQKLDADKWVDKRIARIDADGVTAVAITKIKDGAEEEVIHLKKEEVDGKKQWQSVKPYAFGLSASKIKRMIETFNNTYAREVIAPAEEGGFDAPGWTGVFTLENGEQTKIVRGSKDADGNNYYVRREGAGYDYLVPVSTFDSREKQQGDIFAGNPLKVEEGNVESIEVRDIDGKKEFRASKKEPPETAEAPAEEKTGEPQSKKEDVWETPGGEAVETAKVRDIITKIKGFNVEMVPRPASSLKNMLTIRVTKEGETKEYAVSKDIKLDNGKECHFLTVNADSQGYCVSKSQVTALQSALP